MCVVITNIFPVTKWVTFLPWVQLQNFTSCLVSVCLYSVWNQKRGTEYRWWQLNALLDYRNGSWLLILHIKHHTSGKLSKWWKSLTFCFVKNKLNDATRECKSLHCEHSYLLNTFRCVNIDTYPQATPFKIGFDWTLEDESMSTTLLTYRPKYKVQLNEIP